VPSTGDSALPQGLTPERLARARTVQLTTRGRKTGQPRTVKIWFVVAGPRSIYVQHTNPKPADWYRNLAREPAVTVDFGTGPIAARATPITDPNTIEQILALVRRRYLAAWIFRILGWTRAAVAAEIALDA
jgi:deazaflavin-dependent oxidoreductase (nitroreductase family)